MPLFGVGKFVDNSRRTDWSIPPRVEGPVSGDTRPTEWHPQGCECDHCKRTGSNRWQPGPPGKTSTTVKTSSFGTVNIYSLTNAGETLKDMIRQAGNEVKQVVGYIQTQNPGKKFEVSVLLNYYENADIYDPDFFMITADQMFGDSTELECTEGRVQFSDSGTQYNLWVKCRKL
ncbi:hypothetical protein ACUN0G_15425 [Pseudomonas sp. 32A]|uniref:hypothetical protein n=1 Tax=Pseudomonas sp. 32A TaxID=651185 RepID=UPI004045853F